jgi:hypothetical protein
MKTLSHLYQLLVFFFTLRGQHIFLRICAKSLVNSRDFGHYSRRETYFRTGNKFRTLHLLTEFLSRLLRRVLVELPHIQK